MIKLFGIISKDLTSKINFSNENKKNIHIYKLVSNAKRIILELEDGSIYELIGRKSPTGNYVYNTRENFRKIQK